MMDVNMSTNADDFRRCCEIVKKELYKRDVVINENILEKITEDIMNVSISKGGDFADKTIQSIAEVYIAKELYKLF